MKKVLSIELNSKKAKVGVINQYGEVESELTIPNNLDNLMNNLASKTKMWLRKSGYDYHLDIESIGLAVPGFIDHYHGVVKLADAFNWKEFDLRKVIQKEFRNKRIYILNSANARALGEFWTGAATSYNSELFYSLGRRVGGAIVIDGKLILGEHGFAGEFGHGGLTSYSEEKCECGLKNCLEPVASTVGLTKKFVRILQADSHHPVRQYFDQDFDFQNLTFEKITEVYRENSQPKSMKNLLKQIFKPLISHISIMISAIDPKSIVIGGDILTLGEDVIEIIYEELEPLVPDFEKKSLVLKTTNLGKTAGIVGAAYFAINSWDE